VHENAQPMSHQALDAWFWFRTIEKNDWLKEMVLNKKASDGTEA
jgi:hypothetical protein